MGFIIQESIQIVRLGVSVPGVFVTFRGSCTVHKSPSLPNVVTASLQIQPEVERFVVTGRMVFYSGRQYEALQPLHEENVTITLQSYPPSDPLGLLYAKAKSLFPGFTLVDD